MTHHPYAYTIFSVDKSDDLYELNRTIRHLDRLTHEGKMNGKVIPCIGSYRGKLEHSFIMRTDDFYQFVRDKWFMKEQESYVQVSDDKYMRARLLYADGSVEDMGRMHTVTADEAYQQEGWTYRPDLDIYWVTTRKED